MKMIIDVKAEINKYKNCNDRDKLERAIFDYKNQVRQNATDFVVAGQFNRIVLELQKIVDKLPAPKLKNVVSSRPNVAVKTAKITSNEAAKIDEAWKQKAGNKGK
jgi:hypothetical protein